MEIIFSVDVWMDMCVSHFGYKMMLCGYEAADILYVCMNIEYLYL